MNITKFGLNCFASFLYTERKKFGRLEELMEWFSEVMGLNFGAKRWEELEEGQLPKLRELSTLARFASLSTLRGKPFLINNKTGKPFEYLELVALLQSLP